jgi:hypothetical protein
MPFLCVYYWEAICYNPTQHKFLYISSKVLHVHYTFRYNLDHNQVYKYKDAHMRKTSI